MPSSYEEDNNENPKENLGAVCEKVNDWL